MNSLALKSCFPRHSDQLYSQKVINPPSTLEPVGLTGDGMRPDGLTLGPWYRRQSLVWDTKVMYTFDQCHYKNSAFRQALQQQRLQLQNAEDTMTLLTITVLSGKSTAPFWWPCKETCLCLVIPGSDSGSTSACPWLWSKGILPAYWPVCKFDLILAIPSVLSRDGHLGIPNPEGFKS